MDQNLENITQKELLDLIKSKDDFYQLFAYNGGYLCPVLFFF